MAPGVARYKLPQQPILVTRAPRLGALKVRANPWDAKLVAATARPIVMDPYHPSTRVRRERADKIFRLLSGKVQRAGDIIGAMAQVYTIRTTQTMAFTMQSLRPELKKNESWQDALLWVGQQVATTSAKTAIPIKAEEMRILLARTENVDKKLLFAVQWVAAGRYGDFPHMIPTAIWPHPPHPQTVVLRVVLPVWKSDRRGVRKCAKQLVLPAGMARRLALLLQSKRIPSYQQMSAALKKVHPLLSMHSIRRGAISTLAETNAPESIVVLTQHAMPNEPLALRTYIDPSPLGEEAKVQQTLSFQLLQQIL